MVALGVSSALLAFAAAASAGDSQKTTSQNITDQSFDRDPGWDSFNNRVKPENIPTVVQDFGYSRTTFASLAPGEIGGRIARASEPAWYGTKINPKTLDDKFSASGTFAITRAGGSGGVCFGWFNGNQIAGTGRPISSLFLDLTTKSNGGRLAVRMISPRNMSCGTFITRFERYHTIEEKAVMRPSPIHTDGTRYHWQIAYDPAAKSGKGEVRFTIKSDSAKPADFEGKEFTFELPDGFKKQGTLFDHFGMIDLTRPGGSADVYFGDLALDGEPLNLSTDPNWDHVGNRAKYQAVDIPGCQNFGYSASTNHAGGKPGEIGGLIWRAPYAFYADCVGSLSLNDPLEARGRFILESGGPDSEFRFGWFNSSVKETDDQKPLEGRNFIGVAVGGPTKIGHYFLPACQTAESKNSRVKRGPIIKLGKTYQWKLVYDPSANGGNGQMRLTLGDESATLDLNAGEKSKDAVFDRFGIFGVGTGGGELKAWLDDLHYTSKPN